MDNSVRYWFNQTKAIQYATQTKQKLLYIVAKDTYKSSCPTKAKTKMLLKVGSSTTKYTEGLLPVVENMPIVFKSNFGTELGITNGTMGTLLKIILDPREQVNWDDKVTPHYLVFQPIALLIHCKVKKPFKLPDMEENVYPYVLKSKHIPTRNVSVSCDYNNRTYTTSRLQFMVAPAWSITVHTAQGSTKDNNETVR